LPVADPIPFTQIDRFAGSLAPSGTTNGVGPAARFSSTFGGLARIGSTIYIADHSSQTIRSLDLTTRNVGTVAGNPAPIASMDGPGSQPGFANLQGIIALGGQLYVGDRYTIRRVDPTTGAVTTVAGGNDLGATDGIGTQATLGYPLAFATDGTDLFFI